MRAFSSILTFLIIGQSGVSFCSGNCQSSVAQPHVHAHTSASTDDKCHSSKSDHETKGCCETGQCSEFYSWLETPKTSISSSIDSSRALPLVTSVYLVSAPNWGDVSFEKRSDPPPIHLPVYLITQRLLI